MLVCVAACCYQGRPGSQARIGDSWGRGGHLSRTGAQSLKAVLWIRTTDFRILLFSSVADKMPTENKFFAYLHHFS